MSYTVLQCPVLTAKERPHRRFSQPMKALFKLFRRFDARRIFGFIRRLGGMSRPKVKCYDLLSTHALRVEGDKDGMTGIPLFSVISIHALRVEGDIKALIMSPSPGPFLSTPSGWRATSPRQGAQKPTRYFYPRPPGGGRLRLLNRQAHLEAFLSTPSGWRATGGHGLRYADRAGISIHALRVEGDEPPEPPEPTPGNFYPRPPGGGRQTGNVTGIHTHWISIHALRVEGDHDPGRFPRHDRGISIHALRVEGDHLKRAQSINKSKNFYPRPPGGGRPGRTP